MRPVRIRIACALHDLEVSLIVKRLEADKLRVQSEMVVQSQGLFAGDRNRRPGAEIGIIPKWHESVEAVVAARKLEDNQDRAVLSRCRLNSGVRSHGIQREKCALQKGGDRP